MFQSLKRLCILLALGFVLFAPGVCAEELCTKTPDEPNIKIYRVYNPGFTEHLYTPDLTEVNLLVTTGDWVDEGLAWYAPRTGESVYRLYSPVTRAHLYTSDENEKNTLTAEGWIADNGGNPFFYSGGDIPGYRLYNPESRLHLITADINEYNTLPAQGWVQEGIKFYSTNKTTSQSYPIGENDISNVYSEYAIQADVKLSGTGSGNHAKLVAKTATSAISFGLQYDVHGMEQYQDATSFIIENVLSNDKNGQEYIRTGYGAKNKTFRVLLALKKNGTCDLYVNGNKAGSVYNPYLANQKITLTVEGCGKTAGDTVIASFNNVEIKKNGRYEPNKKWTPEIIDTNKGLHSDVSAFKKEKRVVISGVVREIRGDWDSDYGTVSGTVNFE